MDEWQVENQSLNDGWIERNKNLNG